MAVVVEVLIEDPENPRDSELLEVVRRATMGLEGVEVRVFLYHGPHEHVYSCGILRAYKTHTVPAVVVDGELAFGPEIPSVEELRRRLEKRLSEKRCAGG